MRLALLINKVILIATQMMVRAAIICIIGLVLEVSVWAEPHLEGRVRLPSGASVPGAQVLLFDLADLRAAPVAATTDGSGQFTLPLATLSGALPERFQLGANYPNPFNPSTMIPYQLPASMHVRLEVFNILGQRIATLVDGERPAGFHTASWDATDAAGQAVGAGVYLYRLSGDGVQATRSMLLIDGQAGIASGRGGSTGSGGDAGSGEDVETAPVYGLTVSGPGLIPYLDPAFRVEAGMDPLDLVVEAPGRVPPAKAASSGGILGDVDNTGGVDFFDALLVALYSRDASIAMPNNGDISLGDVDADGQVDLTDAYLIAVWLNDPSDPSLPAGIGEPVGPAASLSPDPSTVTFADDGAWHRFTVAAGKPVTVVANPEGTAPRLEITTRSGRRNYCPAEPDDDVSRQDGQAVYLAGCGTGTATVELRRRSDGTVLNTYTFEVTGSPADLVVQSVSVSDSTLTPGQTFRLRATVHNQGTGQSAATTLRYYRSSNRTISTQDTQVGTDAVSGLAASGSSAESISLAAPSSAGTYYYGACVVSVSGESAGNNCSSGVRVTVTVKASRPDLVVASASVSESSPTPRQSFTLRATVRNQGTGLSAATTLRWYRSTNATISTQDTEVGTDAVGALAAAGTSAESIRLTAPSSEGIYYYGACVVSVTGESAGNNCSAGVRVTVEAASPDLVVESAAVSDGTLTTGQFFTLIATVRNQGTGASAATTLRYYRSTNSTISTRDTQVGTDEVGALAVAGTSAEWISLTAPSSEGTYYYGACVATVAGEADTRNNCSLGVRVIVEEPDTPQVNIPDANLRAAIERALRKASGAPITVAEMETLTWLEADSDAGISDLTGLEFAANLGGLLLDYNPITDISLLSGLTNLWRLSLSDTNIPDLSPLSGLTNLELLNLIATNTSDVSPLSGLTNLRSLVLSHNKIADISPLAGLTNLTELNFWENQIEDISPLSGLTNLTRLGLAHNKVSDLSPLSGLTSLTGLWLNNNNITDISPLAGLTNLTWLNLAFNNIADISALSGLTNLMELNLAGNSIADISPLSGLNLRDLDLRGNPYETLPKGDFDIELVLLDDFTESQKNVLQYVTRRWMAVIMEDLPDYKFTEGWSGTCNGQSYAIPSGERIDDLRIYVSTFSGVGVLGHGGPVLVREETHLPVVGCMAFDLSHANLLITGLHEIGHVLGFASEIWSEFGFYQNLPDGDNHFNGPLAIAAFNDAGGRDYKGAKVPLQQTGESHWRGGVFGDELMTPTGTGALSAITVQSLADLGYGVDVTQADPYTLPGTASAKASAKIVAAMPAMPGVDVTQADTYALPGAHPHWQGSIEGGLSLLPGDDRLSGRPESDEWIGGRGFGLRDDRLMGRLAPSPRAVPELWCGAGLRRGPIHVVDPQGYVIRTLGD